MRTTTPNFMATPTQVVEKIKIKVSYYNPALGGINCYQFHNGECVSKMANGERWQDWINNGAIACPFEIDLEQKIHFDGNTYVCKDRGSKVVFDGEFYWIDILTDNPEYSFGDSFDAILLY